MPSALLPLVPSTYVDSSLFTAVLLGVLLLFVLGELYGWPQSGLVVPGYLAGVLVIQPAAAAVIAIEAVLTWALAVALGRGLPRILPISRPFGRDRFFLILLCSVFVRLAVEAGWGEDFTASMGWDVHGPFHSMGLVLVPLAANALWMPGLLRGVPLVGLPVLAVYWLLDGVLLPYTNLNLSHFAFTYENLAHDFVSVPRAYILLLVSTLLAMRLNLRFGWEFGGVLVPGLLAIAWIHPEQLLATLAEVLVTVWILRLLTCVPPFSRVNLSGLRPLVLAFSVSYLLKLGLAVWLGENAPGLRATDLFGFGYLLPSLVVVRCWRQGQLMRVLLPTTLASLGGFVLGSGVGMALEGLRPLTTDTPQELAAPPQIPAWQALARGTLPRVPGREPDEGTLRSLWDAAQQGWPSQVPGLRVDNHPDGWVLRGEGDTGLGRLWFRPHAATGLWIIAPQADRVPAMTEAAIVLAELLDAQALALSPAPVLLELAQEEAGHLLVLHSADETSLHAAGSLPAGLHLDSLQRVFGTLTTRWDAADPRTITLSMSESGRLSAALLRFSGTVESGRIPLLGNHVATKPLLPTVEELATLDRGVLQPLLLARTGDPRWAHLAAAHAASLKLAVAADEDTLSLGPGPGRQSPRWTLWLRRTAGNWVFEAPAAGRQAHTALVARSWWSAMQGGALLVHDAKADRDARALDRAGFLSEEGVALRRMALETEDLSVISVAGFRQDENPGADAIVSLGRPLLPTEEAPVELEATRRLVERAGGTTLAYTGAATQFRFHDPSNARRDMVELAQGRFLSVWLSPLYRLRFPLLADSNSLRSALQSVGLPVREESLDALVAHDPLSPEEVLALYGEVLEGLARYGRSTHPGELEGLRRQAAQAGIHLEVVVDAEAVPYLKAVYRRTHLVVPLSRFNGQISDTAGDVEALRTEGAAIGFRRQR